MRRLVCPKSSKDGCSVWPVIAVTYAMSTAHALTGLLSIIIGVLSSLDAEVWMAHRVSPIWSGAFYLLTAVVGIICAKKRNAYLVMCFGGLCIVSMVVAVVCIQLARLGLVTHLSDGETYRQDELDVLVVLALVASGLEILLCILSFPISCRMAAKVKQEVHMKRDGTFSIQIIGDKDIIIHQNGTSGSYDKLMEDDTLCDLVKLANIGSSTTSNASYVDSKAIELQTHQKLLPLKIKTASCDSDLDTISGVV